MKIIPWVAFCSLSVAFLLGKCLVVADHDKSLKQCGKPSDSCMDEASYQHCKDLIEKGRCQHLVVMKDTCPIQFACAGKHPKEVETETIDSSDSTEGILEKTKAFFKRVFATSSSDSSDSSSSSSSYSKSSHSKPVFRYSSDSKTSSSSESSDSSSSSDSNSDSADSKPLIKSSVEFEKSTIASFSDSESVDSPWTEPDACVTLYIYENSECNGNPGRELSFPTWTKPGSPCYHDVMTPHFSVSNQYCNMDTGNWHEKLFFGSKTCQPSHFSHWHHPPLDLTFTTDSCIGGMSLKSCAPGGCSGTPQVVAIEEALVIPAKKAEVDVKAEERDLV